ncbi:hypothetical protein EV672_11242 [Aquabacterium commune]|jgi:hypothetical protein|uniref:Ig-like domain-containing protein n=1 Tax=Aquabacterium commune TaxID=70586 RepID=A0A4R6R1K5_9BURK|nr:MULTISPECIES: hypothetical protein [Burkholderiales]MCU0918832.1 hypothetical protein [Burkholderiaceae bacterium]OGB01205.1 MAG: hypothetical protein A3E52_07455 [Burkholderiales bacterium RIFCSPHIGHO2_12_FULL_63_20]OGB61094.1 MAG: hypothetical protein A3G29_06300 [Burkholderiales bacterium RIFCSPLOWO2_12_FULL_64_99]MBK6616057.1 hypothetical protein [Ottowia sp.]MCR5864520.1 hypothetical protein [Aquincola sp. J276]
MRHPLSKFSAVLMHAALAAAAGLASLPGHAADGAESLTYTNITKIRDGMGARGDLAPIARIVSPLADSQIVPGEGRIGAGSVNGTGFVLNIEVVTRDATPIAAKESLNIRNTALLGQINPNIPGLYVFLDTDLVKPDGGVIPKNTNLANLFNILGTDDTPGAGVTLWLGWHVLESLPLDTSRFNITTAVVDTAGRIGFDRVSMAVLRGGITSGQALTPLPIDVFDDGIDDADGPEVTMIAPRVPSRVSPGPQTGNPTPPANASLFFIQVAALDRSRHGIGVSENGQGTAARSVLGTILDGSQIQNPITHPSNGTNRNFPGLNVTFDVPLRQPNGNVVPAGSNLAPIFNVAGSELDADGYVVTTADWVVGGSLLMPAGKRSVTITARVTDNANRTRSVSHVVGISPVENGQTLTPAP